MTLTGMVMMLVRNSVSATDGRTVALQGPRPVVGVLSAPAINGGAFLWGRGPKRYVGGGERGRDERGGGASNHGTLTKCVVGPVRFEVAEPVTGADGP